MITESEDEPFEGLFEGIHREIDRRLELFKLYSGRVMKIGLKGLVKLHVFELHTDLSDPLSWIPARPGNLQFSMSPPLVGQSVLIMFPKGTPDQALYIAHDPATYISTNWKSGTQVLFELPPASIHYEVSSQTLTVMNGALQVKLNAATGMATVTTAGASLVLDAQGATLTGNLTVSGAITGGTIATASGLPLAGHDHEFTDNGASLRTGPAGS